MVHSELQAIFDRTSGPWPEEAKAFSRSLLLVVKQLEDRVKSLEDQLALNSGNSSLPPSRDAHGPVKAPPPRQAPARKAGGQKGHFGQGGKLKAVPSLVVPLSLGGCPACGEDLRPVPLDALVRRQVEDIPEIRPTVTEYRAEVKTCPGCGAQWQAGGHNARHEFEYGPNVKALAVYLSTYQFIPQKRVKELLGVFGIELSTGTLNNFRKAAAKRLGPFMGALRQKLVSSPSAHFDETGIKVGGANHWAHVACTKTLSFFGIHRNRGQKAHQDMGILPNFSGIAHRDCYRPYDAYQESRDSLCCAHIIRELRFAIERDGQGAWAQPMVDLLLYIKKQVEARPDATADTRWQGRHRKKYRELVGQGLKMNPAAQKPGGRAKGAIKQSKTYNLLVRLRDREDGVLRFMAEPLAEFTNNQAERDLRMNKVRAKVSGGFRAFVPAEEFMQLRSLISTAVKQAVCPLKTLSQVFSPGNTDFMRLVDPD